MLKKSVYNIKVKLLNLFNDTYMQVEWELNFILVFVYKKYTAKKEKNSIFNNLLQKMKLVESIYKKINYKKQVVIETYRMHTYVHNTKALFRNQF